MRRLLTLVLTLACSYGFAQTGNSTGTIEFYLLKRQVPNLNTASFLFDEFKVNRPDLADTPIIKNSEILMMVKTDTVRDPRNHKLIPEHYRFVVPEAVVTRINSLKAPRQFAVIVNGEISYAGYFWNYFSSLGCEWITAFAVGNTIDVLRKLPDYNTIPEPNDPRNEPLLINCLKATKRYSSVLVR